MYDLTSRGLTREETEVLEKGLTFIPTKPHRDPFPGALQDLVNFQRRMLLRIHFGRDEKEVSKRDRLKAPSTWTPKPPHPGISLYLQEMTKELRRSLRPPHLDPLRWNLTPSQRRALTNLRGDPGVTIKAADKGGATVAMDTTAYNQACEAMLHTSNYSTPTRDNQEVQDETSFVIGRMWARGMMKEATADYCKNQQGADRPFFGLPKVHKERSKWTFGIPPLRPIISDCPSATYVAGKLLDTFLQPISTLHASYLRDTAHMRKVVQETQPPDRHLLVTCDVEALYTSIPHEAGIAATREALLRHHTHLATREVDLLCRLLHLQLHHNNFRFNGREYTQNHGVAMGKAWAPAYANLYMASWEEKLKAATKHLLAPTTWRRFIDDVFCVYPGDQAEWDEYLAVANGLDPNIHLTAHSSTAEVPFLDLTIVTEAGQLYHRLHRKETDTLQYVRADSMHPTPTHRSVAISQFLRALRNCSRLEDQQLFCRETAQALRQRGYSARLLRLAYRRAVSSRHTELAKETLHPQGNSDQPTARTRDILCATFHPALRNLPLRLREAHQQAISRIGSRDPELQRITQAAIPDPPMVAWRRNQNLRDLLVHATTR